MLFDAGVEPWLRARFGAGVDAVAPLGQGEWSRAFAFRLDGRERVIRFSAFDEDFCKDIVALRFAGPHLPIPAVSEVGPAPAGGFYAISERAHGPALDELDEAAMRAALPAVLAALDAMREADLNGTTGYGVWLEDGHAPHPSWRAALLDIASDGPHLWKHGWRACLETSPSGAHGFDEAYAALGGLVGSCPEERSLIHSDLLHGNVLVNGPRLAGIIDWGCAMWGDFLYDLAWLCYWAPWYPAWRGIDFAGEFQRHYAAIELPVPNIAKRLACYQIHIGLAAQAFYAYKGRWDALAASVARTRDIAKTIA